MPTISAIVPVYKVEPYIDECIKSILNQTYGDFELILVDDGSPDGCPKICDKYARLDKRVKVIHKTNGGLSSARNEGLKSACGEYISFIDGDDFIESRLFEKCLNIFKKYKVDSVRFGYSKVLKDTSIKKREFLINGYFDFAQLDCKLNFLINKLLKFKIPFQACMGMFKLSIINNYDIVFADNNVVFSEDVYFSTLYTIFTNNLYMINEQLYFYRDTPNSIMSSVRKNNNLKISEYNEMSKILLSKCRERYFIDRFSEIHFALIMIRIAPVFKRITRRVNRQFHKVDDIAYFKQMNLTYYLNHRKKFRKEFGFLYGTKMKVFCRYLSNLRFFEYKIKNFVCNVLLLLQK